MECNPHKRQKYGRSLTIAAFSFFMASSLYHPMKKIRQILICKRIVDIEKSISWLRSGTNRSGAESNWTVTLSTILRKPDFFQVFPYFIEKIFAKIRNLSAKNDQRWIYGMKRSWS